MQDYLKPENTGPKTGACPICDINLYGDTITHVGNQTVTGTPVVMPCRIRGNTLNKGDKIEKGTVLKPVRYNCPFEDSKPIEVEKDFTLRLTGGTEVE